MKTRSVAFHNLANGLKYFRKPVEDVRINYTYNFDLYLTENTFPVHYKDRSVYRLYHGVC